MPSIGLTISLANAGQGGGGAPAPDYIRSDLFTRADTAPGGLGTPVSADGIPAFANNWSFIAGSGAYGQILSNRYTTDPAQSTPNVYAKQTITEGNIQRFEVVVDVRGTIGPGVPPASTGTVMILPTDFNSGIHMQWNPYSMYLDYLTPGGVPVNIVAQTPYEGYTPITAGVPMTIVGMFDAAGNYDIRFTSADFTPPLVIAGQSNNLIGQLGPNLVLQCYQTNANHAVQWLKSKVGIKALGA